MYRTDEVAALVWPAEDLAALAAAINAAHQAGEEATRRGLEHYRAAGEALIRAKRQCGHGRWLGWIERHLRFGERQARRYMALAKSDVTSDLDAQWRIISGNAPPAEEKADADAAQASGGQDGRWDDPAEIDAPEAVQDAPDAADTLGEPWDAHQDAPADAGPASGPEAGDGPGEPPAKGTAQPTVLLDDWLSPEPTPERGDAWEPPPDQAAEQALHDVATAKRALAAVGVLVRTLCDMRLFERHKHALESIKADVYRHSGGGRQA
jgi:hypothetical protein